LRVLVPNMALPKEVLKISRRIMAEVVTVTRIVKMKNNKITNKPPPKANPDERYLEFDFV